MKTAERVSYSRFILINDDQTTRRWFICLLYVINMKNYRDSQISNWLEMRKRCDTCYYCKQQNIAFHLKIID